MTPPPDLPTALFHRTGDRTYLPTQLSVGPWDPGALHGGPPAALVAGALQTAVDEAAGGIAMFPARLTVELLRPVPLAELTLTTTVRRPGRKVCVVDATLAGPDGTVCLSATLGAIRVAPFDRPVDEGIARPDPPSGGWGVSISGPADQVMFARQGVEHRVVAGRFEDRGPATDWIRVRVPMVDDRDPTPLERVVCAADFGNGVSKWFEMSEVLFLNPDLTVNLHRLPEGEFVCIDAVTRIGPDGVGLAESVLFDESGPIGRATQSLLVEHR